MIGQVGMVRKPTSNTAQNATPTIASESMKKTWIMMTKDVHNQSMGVEPYEDKPGGKL